MNAVLLPGKSPFSPFLLCFQVSIIILIIFLYFLKIFIVLLSRRDPLLFLLSANICNPPENRLFALMGGCWGEDEGPVHSSHTRVMCSLAELSCSWLSKQGLGSDRGPAGFISALCSSLLFWHRSLLLFSRVIPPGAGGWWE